MLTFAISLAAEIQDHIHQVVFIGLSLLALVLPIGEFLPRRVERA
jgi:hypothetical protein